ncbi:MAG: type IV pilus twitching motility protein PilT [Candidatus Kerfeldbacteria bacterium]|nr:type IV pilus twitching motility protein PilT [Candidatus Kerfeldbacteria bacterium]
MTLHELLTKAVEASASDLHLIVGQPPTVRIDGGLETLDSYPPLTASDTKSLIYSVLSAPQIKRFEYEQEFDTAYELPGLSRFRINLHYELRNIGVAIRLIPKTVPTPSQLGFDETIYELTHLNNGLVLVTGPSGSGKSTTIAAMIDIVNTERRAHIITIEDPIEFVFTPKQSIIEQREVDIDTHSFFAALKRILRQDPNVIFVGEMRDLETFRATLTAAETGHLVFSTLHTPNAAQTVDRIIDTFPPYQQDEARLQLSGVPRAIIAQQLVPSESGGRVAAREILINTPAVANLIRENQIAQIPSTMQMGIKEGMRTMDLTLRQLYLAGAISETTARNRMIDPEKLTTYF